MHNGTWLLDLGWKPFLTQELPTGSRGSLGKKGPRKGSSFGKCNNLIVFLLSGRAGAEICNSSASDLLALASEITLCDVVTCELRFSFKCLKLLLMLEKVTSATHFLCH